MCIRICYRSKRWDPECGVEHPTSLEVARAGTPAYLPSAHSLTNPRSDEEIGQPKRSRLKRRPLSKEWGCFYVLSRENVSIKKDYYIFWQALSG